MPAYADTVTPAKAHSPPLTHNMTPLTTNTKEYATPRYYENVVISGMSGKFPESQNIEEFAQNLYGGVDMVTEDDRRWTPGAYGLPKRSGKLLDLAHFDSSFFSVSPRQAHMMDPQLRILLELTHEAILDAGMNPTELRGRRVGVYVGVSSSESEEVWIADPSNVTGYALTGCCRAMFANRISYTFDFKGPSFAIDTACSSSMVAFQNAWKAISDGEIEAAIVAGSNLTLKPQNALQFNSLNMLAKDGKCKSFDASGNGYVRSEAIAVVFLQRAPQARRVYAHVVHARANTDGNKGEGITFPSGAVQQQLLQEVYTHTGVSPKDVSYVEAHGTGTKVGDPQEVNALAEVFCAGRTEPLFMGSVKSNMGHSEAASGLCSIVKVMLAMQRGEIARNLHFSTPNPEIPALVDGRIKVVSENTPWKGGYAAVNSFGFGGANVHILLHSANPTDSSLSSLLIPTTQRVCPALPTQDGTNDGLGTSPGTSTLPRLVVTSGRSEEAVTEFLEAMKQRATPDLCGLLDKFTEMPVNTNPVRGFVVTNSENTIPQATRLQSQGRPLWLMFSGMGSQWTGCGKSLMRLPRFAAAIRRCHAVLQPLGLDLIEILTSDDPSVLSSTAASFSSIAAMQVGLLELLRQVGIQEISGMVGHSVGELGCAYADDALTAEQTVLAAYWRGRAVEEATLPPGGMAAVGLSVTEAQKWCRDGVIVACHNAHDSVTISGPKDTVDSILGELTAEGIFCRAVRSEGVAFHHPSLKAAAPRLFEELKKIIPEALARSERWVSTSVPEGNSSNAKEASAQYLVNNLLSPVLFSEALEKVPQDAVIVEVSPHGLLQAILRRAFPDNSPIALIRKDAKCPLIHFLEALGKMYGNGISLDVGALYPPTSIPVHPSTPSIASFLRWDHNQEWDVARYNSSPSGSEYEVKVDLDSDAHKYLEGHTIDGRVIFPATGYMVLAWQALCRLKGLQWEETAVTFSDVKLHQATVLSSSSSSSNITTLTVRILLAKGEFEVVVSDSVAASGCIHLGVEHANDKSLMNYMKEEETDCDDKPLLKKDVYRELRLRGYQYKGIFQGIVQTDLKGTQGTLTWNENWVSFLDTFLQFSLVGSKHRGLMLPTRIRKVTVDPSSLHCDIDTEKDENTVPVYHNPLIGTTASRGVVIQGLKASMAPRRPTQDQPLLQTHQFIPFHVTEDLPVSSELSEQAALGLLIDLVVENGLMHTLKIVESDTCKDDESSALEKIQALNSISCIDMHPQLKVDYTLHTGYKLNGEEQQQLSNFGVTMKDDIKANLSSAHLVILHQPVDKEFVEKVKENAFILTKSEKAVMSLKDSGYEVVASIKKYELTLMKKMKTDGQHEVLEIHCSDTEFSWVTHLKERLAQVSTLWLISSGEPNSGILGFVNCLRREPEGEKIRCLFVPGKKGILDSGVISKDIAVNVFQDGMWGTYRHLPLPPLVPKASSHALLNVATRGDLSSLTWYQAPTPESQEMTSKVCGELLVCDVHYAPLNFRDIMLATGKLPPDALPGDLAMKECILGLEFAGTSKGDRVMGLVAAGGLATTVKADPLLTWKVPSSWSLKDASTVPVVYATAYYALVVRGGLQEGESVLIHAGSGGVGQAAISIALARSCTVFTTVSSEKKKKVLQERFPQLKDENFANSRDISFEYDVLERTGGQGVHVVLNSLAGELLQASVRCLREHGRFLEIGKADLANNTALGMAVFLKNVTFHGILLDALFDGSEMERKRLNQILKDGLDAGVVKPLPSTLFTRDCVEDAFRYMATGKHIGKVVLEIKAEKETTNVEAIPRLNAHSNMVYVITGGMGGLGLELAGWLISRGVQKLVLTSRRGITTGYQALRVQRWIEDGINVRILTQDASTVEGATALLKEAAKEGPVGGIFHLAVVLKDALFENQTGESFYAVNHVKGDGAVAVDIASRTCCPNLHLWVAFSSVACGKGNAGQTNYGWANSVSERVVEERVRLGLPGVVIQWGGVGEVGVLADTLGDIEVGGTKPQSVRSVLECLDVLLLNSSPIVSSVCLATKASKKSDGKGGSLVKSVANILGVKDLSKVPLEVTLGDLGLDSLMSVEVKQTLEREADLVLTAVQVRELTLKMIQDMENLGGTNATEAFKDSESVESPETPKPVNDLLHGTPVPWLALPLIPNECVSVLKKEGRGAPLFLTAPIHGSASPLLDMVQDLDRPVYGLQYPPNVPHTSIPELAKSLTEKLQEIHPSGEFILGGYSFGTSITLEMTKILEAQNRSPSSLVLLDGSQSYVSGIIDLYKARHNSNKDEKNTNNSNNKIQEQVVVLLVFALQFISMNALALKETLTNMKSWEQRVNHVAKLVTQSRVAAGINTSSDEQQQAVTAAELLYRRLIMSDQHVADYNIKTPTMLIRAKENPQAPVLGQDYGLSKVLVGTPRIEEVSGTHETFLAGENGKQVALLIQSFMQQSS